MVITRILPVQISRRQQHGHQIRRAQRLQPQRRAHLQVREQVQKPVRIPVLTQVLIQVRVRRLRAANSLNRDRVKSAIRKELYICGEATTYADNVGKISIILLSTNDVC